MKSIVEQTLSNGIQLLCEVRHHAPVVALQWWINVGGADEQPGWIGAAHLHEHMLFKGTTGRQVGQIAQEIESLGGDINAWTSLDETVYHITLPSQHWQAGMDVLADMFFNATFEPEALAAEKEVVVEEIARAQDNSQRRLYQTVFRNMYGDHPYSRPVLGTKESVRGITQAELLAFYHHYYVPEQLRVVVVGPVDPQAIAQWLSQHKPRLGQQGGAKPKMVRATRAEMPQGSGWVTHLLQEQVEETRLMLAWPGLAFGDEQGPWMDVALAILGQGESSRLWDVLRRERSLVYDVGIYPYTPKDGGLLLLSAGLEPTHLLATLTGIGEVIGRVQEQGVTSEECRVVQQALVAQQAYVEETMEGRARQLGRYAHHPQGIGAIAAYRQAILQVTPEQVQTWLQTWLAQPPQLFVQTSQQTSPQWLEPQAWHQAWQKGFKGSPAPGPADKALPRTQSQSQKMASSSSHQAIALPNGCWLDLCGDGGSLVSFRALWPGGQRLETLEHAGAAQLLARMWATATQLYRPKAWSDALLQLGGSLHGFAGRHSLGLAATFPEENAVQGARLFVEAMLQPVWLASVWQEEQAALLEERKTIADRPGALATEKWLAMLMGNHPSGRSVQGDVASLSRLTLADILHYANQWLIEQPMVMAVSGGFDREGVQAVLTHALEQRLQDKDKRLGESWGLDELYQPIPLQAPSQHEAHMPSDKSQVQVRLGAQGTTLIHADRFALDVLCAALNGQSGRLFLDLRDKQSLAYSVGAQHMEGIEAGFILLAMATHPDKCEQALQGLRHHIDGVQQQPLSVKELARAKATLQGDYVMGYQRSAVRALLTAQSRLMWQQPMAWQDYSEHIEQVSQEQVLQVAQRYLSPERLVQCTLGSYKKK